MNDYSNSEFLKMMRLSETNFAQLCRLLPQEKQKGAAVNYRVTNYSYRLTILEMTPYTTLVEICQTVPSVSYWSLPSMSVRLYYDALVAEVCATKQICHFKSRYDYPNKKLHQRDEKHQMNQFLADWLCYCLMHGVAANSLCHRWSD